MATIVNQHYTPPDASIALAAGLADQKFTAWHSRGPSFPRVTSPPCAPGHPPAPTPSAGGPGKRAGDY